MSVDPSSDDFRRELSKEIGDALIAQCHLSDENVERIRGEMKTSQLNFSEAAIKVGAVTPNELRAAAEWVRRTTESDEYSLVQAAIRRHVKTRDLVIKHSVQVRPTRELVLLQDPDGPHSERLRALRTELMLIETSASRSNPLALLSPGTGEGRSQLAAELAIAFAQLGRRTLLVDGDLRQPRQHVLFNAENNWGLAQSLAFNEAPRLYGVENLPHLSLLTSGLPVPNPLELLSDGRFERRMAEWRKHYDSIIIDTPPVTAFSDALALATLAGRVLVLSRAKVTAHKDMKEMLRRLANTQSRILGAVINKF